MNTSCPVRKDVETNSGTKKTEKLKNKTGKTGDSLASGVMILTVSNLLVKTLGMFFKIPMNYFVGDTGMGYYNAAYTIYSFFYMLSTAGLPAAVSVMAAAARADGQQRQCRRILHTALGLFCLIGMAGSAVFGFFSEELAGLIGAPPASLCILAIAPTLFFVCIASALRGYFQGCSLMVPTAVSQLLEALCKVGVGILGAMYGIRSNAPPQVTAAYAIVGLTLGSAVSMLYLLVRDMITRTSGYQSQPQLLQPVKTVLKNLTTIALPVTLSSAVMSLTGVMDTLLIQRLLQQNGFTEETAAAMYGNYTSLAVPLFNLPPVLVYPVAYAIVPVLAGSRHEKHGPVILSALRIAVLLGLPCSMGLAVLSEPILKLLYRESSALTAAPLLTLLAPSSLLVCILAVTNSVLQSIGKPGLPVYSMLAGTVVKGTAEIVLIPYIGMAAAPISTFTCYLIVTTMNLYFLIRHTSLRSDGKADWMKPFAASLICAGSAWLVYSLCCTVFSERLSVLMAIPTAAGVYLFLIRKLRILKAEDILLLPGKRKLRKWFAITENGN
ncbi:MAG: polysaccharide biosynthesis protein [Clostridia bacterium]|nr:polysaccharide biosynthesis protein [Clostridia bacterium]